MATGNTRIQSRKIDKYISLITVAGYFLPEKQPDAAGFMEELHRRETNMATE